MLQCNCYVLALRPGADAIIVDPGQRAFGPLRRILDENRLTPAAVLLTHGHIDHMWSAQKVADTYGCPVYIHPEDRFMLTDPISGLRSADWRSSRSARLFREPRATRRTGPRRRQGRAGRHDRHRRPHAGPHQGLGGVPGGRRATGGSGIVDDGPNDMVFTGDTLFKQSIGRTDLPGGSGRDLLNSIVDKTVGARRRHRGTTGARPDVHDRPRTPHQPVPRRSGLMISVQAP